MATTITATRQVVEDCRSCSSANRSAYTMQSMRPHPETGAALRLPAKQKRN